MTYREYAKLNDSSRTDEMIESQVEFLFGADTEMNVIVRRSADCVTYNMNGYLLHCNNSTYDVVVSIDEFGEEIESWILEY